MKGRQDAQAGDPDHMSPKFRTLGTRPGATAPKRAAHTIGPLYRRWIINKLTRLFWGAYISDVVILTPATDPFGVPQPKSPPSRATNPTHGRGIGRRIRINTLIGYLATSGCRDYREQRPMHWPAPDFNPTAPHTLRRPQWPGDNSRCLLEALKLHSMLQTANACPNGLTSWPSYPAGPLIVKQTSLGAQIDSAQDV